MVSVQWRQNIDIPSYSICPLKTEIQTNSELRYLLTEDRIWTGSELQYLLTEDRNIDRFWIMILLTEDRIYRFWVTVSAQWRQNIDRFWVTVSTLWRQSWRTQMVSFSSTHWRQTLYDSNLYCLSTQVALYIPCLTVTTVWRYMHRDIIFCRHLFCCILCLCACGHILSVLTHWHCQVTSSVATG